VRRPSEASFLVQDAVESDPALLATGVSVRYPRASSPALEKVSLRVEAGRVAALLGPNGSGKSTLLRVAAGTVPTTAGDVRVFVAMGRAPHQDGWMRERAEDRDVIDEVLVRCDLVGLRERRVEELSGGEQRRVAVARALAQRPRLLLLDEPAAFLDVRHRMELYDLLEEIAANDRVACVIAMHELDAAAQVASQVLLLRDGRVIAAGTPHEVMTPEKLRDAFDAVIDTSVHAATGQRYFVTRRERPAGP
jgi:iron complex transport system ATP-binding protein